VYKRQLITATGGGGNSGVTGGARGAFTAIPQGVGIFGFAGGTAPANNAGGNAALGWGFGGSGSGVSGPGGSIAGSPGTGYGAGGGGSSTQSNGLASAGGNGTSGFVIVEEFY
jgi:hypothetical protein